METLLLMFDTAAILVVVIYSYRNEQRPADSPEFGPFRLKPEKPPEAPPRAVPPVRRRRTRFL